MLAAPTAAPARKALMLFLSVASQFAELSLSLHTCTIRCMAAVQAAAAHMADSFATVTLIPVASQPGQMSSMSSTRVPNTSSLSKTESKT